jgi:Kef-type K+ transport system membrane component KefB/mannitol/fructose-specific phosphotransferase system IIA component
MPRLPGADPLLTLAAILIVGVLLGWLAQRIRLPSVTGQILAGVLLGPSALALFDEGSIQGLEPLTHFALALIGVTVGAHLNVRRLRNAGRRLFWLLILEALITPLVVGWTVFTFTDAPLTMGVLLATLAVSTAPATIIALVRETRSRGVFVKTLVAAVAINNTSCIFLFELARAAGRVAFSEGSFAEVPAGEVLVAATVQVLQALAVGGALAVLTHLLTLRVLHPDRLATVSVISLLLTFGLASYVDVSPLLACMALGAVQTNLTPARDRIVDSVFSNFEPVILCVFFTLAGIHLSFGHATQAGLITAVFLAARFGGKLLSADLAMRLAGATQRVRENLGMALIPQAGIAVGLVILIQDDPAFASVQEVFTAVVLTAVIANEIVGPVLTRIALGRAGEIGRDRPRLVDFLQEENIQIDLRASTMDEAIERLVDLLISSHHLRSVERVTLLRSVLDREAQVSTCLGQGLAVPHGDLPEGLPMLGVMGLSRAGLDLPTPDGAPIHCMVLLATPVGERDRHLEVLATLARTVGSDLAVQQQLYNAKSPAHAYEILHGEETEDFNYFLDDSEASP